MQAKERASSAAPSAWLPADAASHPWRHSFTRLLRRLSAHLRHQPPVGQAQRPQQEAYRLGQQASLGFAPREIARIEEQAGRAHISLFGLGLLGPGGPLPIHFTELVRERSEAKRDLTLEHFLNLFHHRAMQHQYRAWAQAQAAAGLDRPAVRPGVTASSPSADRAQNTAPPNIDPFGEPFSAYIARLSGDDPHDIHHSGLPTHARLASSAHRVRAARNPDGLVGTLTRYFGVRVRLEEYRLQWMPLEEPDQCRLGWPRPSGQLGMGAIVGDVTPDRQTRFLIEMGPLNMEQYLRLTPQGSATGRDLPTLVEWVRAFVGFEYVWELRLLIDKQAASPCQLGDQARLGWSSWMGGTDPNAPLEADSIVGMQIEPETYAKSF